MPYALIVDDDLHSYAILRAYLMASGYTVNFSSSLDMVKMQISQKIPDLMVMNQKYIEENAEYVFDVCAIKEKITLIMMDEVPVTDKVIEAFRRGALDYLIKPVNALQVNNLLARLMLNRSEQATSMHAKAANEVAKIGVILGMSPVVQDLLYQIERVSPTEASVFLLGESGTGKELVAQTIHAQSLRHKKPFLPLNCGAISPQLIESEIFGHEKGSFTGAERQHKGYFERASGGTLFLDEIVEMPIELQVKLLRVLETGCFMRIGSNQEIRTNVRIIAATNRHPDAAIAEGKLRLDLYHRLNVFPIKIPALRERGQDIALLAQSFLDELNLQNATEKILSEKLSAVLCQYQWPGNVRQLKNFIQRAYILADTLIDEKLFEMERPVSIDDTSMLLSIPIGTSLADADRKLIFATLDLCDGVKKRTADVLGISLKTLYNRLEEYGLREKCLARTEAIRPGTPANIARSLLN